MSDDWILNPLPYPPIPEDDYHSQENDESEQNEGAREPREPGTAPENFTSPHSFPPPGKKVDVATLLNLEAIDAKEKQALFTSLHAKRLNERKRFRATEEQREMVSRMRKAGHSLASIRQSIEGARGGPISMTCLRRVFGEELGTRTAQSIRKFNDRIRLAPRPRDWVPLANSKLSYGDCLQIMMSPNTPKELAMYYGISEGTVNKVKRGQLRVLQHMIPALRFNFETEEPLTVRRKFQLQRDMMFALLKEMTKLMNEFVNWRHRARKDWTGENGS